MTHQAITLKLVVPTVFGIMISIGGRGRDGDYSPPPHRTRRALLTHRAPTLDGDEEPLLRPRMQDAWGWQVPTSDRLHSGPR
jgi:hypothetical protein